MTEALVISNIVLWVIVVVLALLVFALTRQIGILFERIAPAGALQPTSGPKVGELTKPLVLRTINSQEITVGGIDAQGRATLILFISPTCPVCKTLVPTALSLARTEAKRLRLVFASDGETLEKHQNYARDLRLQEYAYLVSQELGMTYQVSKLPFAVLISADGTLQSKGLVNTREHLESLVLAMDSGIATVQEYMGKQKAQAAQHEGEPSLRASATGTTQ